MSLYRVVIARSIASLMSAALVLLSPARSDAQDTTVVLTARVLDNNGAPVGEAEVFIVKLDRAVRTGTDGIFRVTGVPSGRYEVGVRKVGYLPRAITIATGNGTLVPTISIVPFTTRIAPVVTTASRGGLSGVVSDTALNPLAQVRVRVAGSGREVRSDSAGRFFVDVRPGSYLVEVERDSFARQMIAVNIPKDSGRQVAIWMSPRKKMDRATEIMEQMRVFELDRKMIRASRQSSHYFTRDQLLEKGVTDMARLTRQWAHGYITAYCTITVANDGGRPYSVPLNSVESDAVEFVELYQQQPGRGIGSGVGTSKECGSLAIVVWLRL